MLEFLRFAFSAVNLPATSFLCLVLCYWITVILGVLDLDSLDLDLDADMDMDVDADVDMDMDADTDFDAGAGDVSFLTSFMLFMNLGHIPLMIIVSIFALSLWSMTMLSGMWIPGLSPWITLALYLPYILASLLVTKVVSTPLVRVFRHFDSDRHTLQTVTGQLCRLKSDCDERRIAQGEVKTEGAPLLVNVLARKGTKFAKGTKAIIVEKVPGRDAYIVEPFEDWE